VPVIAPASIPRDNEVEIGASATAALAFARRDPREAPGNRTFCDGRHFKIDAAPLNAPAMRAGDGLAHEERVEIMPGKSSEFPTMRALLVGAALTGLIAGTTGAQASAAGASNSGSTHVAAGIVGNAATTTGEKSVTAHCRRGCHRGCRRGCRRGCYRGCRRVA